MNPSSAAHPGTPGPGSDAPALSAPQLASDGGGLAQWLAAVAATFGRLGGRRATPAPGSSVMDALPQSADDIDPYLSARGRFPRKLIIIAIIGYFLIIPAVADVLRGITPTSLFMLIGTVAFAVLVFFVAVAPARPGLQGVPWAWLTVIVALAAALFITGGLGWTTVLAVAAAACGRFTATVRPATFGVVTCTAVGLFMSVHHHYNEGNMAAVIALPAMAAFFAYTAGKRGEMVATLRQTRAELARVAVAEERLRIARDLHDLLGHSLSLITLKAELSRRVIGTDIERASREIAELEIVARQSLRDVREAVAGYRQPDLAAELGAARQLLTAAGVTCHITAPGALGLPGDVDAVLAWAIREGITNVVRHARATKADIAVSVGQRAVSAEIADDGIGIEQGPELARSRLAGSSPTGSGLAGLAERVRALGGDLSAGPVRPSGFRLRVRIPIGGQDS
jgi:two-component system, NarL family, sensor histidine kinase DesK